MADDATRTSTSELRDVLAETRNLLLDFDGPVCSVFAGYPATIVADELRQLIAAHNIALPADILAESDPVQLLRIAAGLGDASLTSQLADALRDAEIVATDRAEPTPHLRDVLGSAIDTGRRLAIVSNNSTAAIDKYLNLHGLRTAFDRVVGRSDGMQPHLLKPSTHLVMLAIIRMDAESWRTTLVGDSATDIAAARAAGIRSIGYANSPAKRTALSDADVVIDSLRDLAAAMSQTPPLAD